jgi:hypothetical protein
MKPQPTQDFDLFDPKAARYQPRSIIYIRERARLIERDFTTLCVPDKGLYRYEADSTLAKWIEIPERLAMPIKGECCPNGCFKELARLFYEVKGVRVERIQDITIADAIREGITDDVNTPNFATVWDSCYSGSWDRNDWVWVYDLERIEK